MKKTAKARAPAAVCLVAAIDMTGGFSPASAFGPVVGTSAGTVGRAGVGFGAGFGVGFGLDARVVYVGSVMGAFVSVGPPDDDALVHAAIETVAMASISIRTPR